MSFIEIIIIVSISIEFLALVFLFIKFFLMSNYLKRLFGKKENSDLEKILDKYVKGVKKYYDDIEELKDFSHELYMMAERSIQKVGFVRFNPFDDVGGNQSFSVALLDLKNNGIVMTSLFGREGTRVYSKPIKDAKSSHHLAEEEIKAVEDAIKKYKKGE